MLSKRYNLINNSLGWLCFIIAAVTYLLTLEPTASFWDCPEFISQADKLEIGHPPGNPIFMLTARFFVNFAGGDPSNVAVAVNAMSAILSAATILLLFWTITHLVRRLMVGRSTDELSTPQLIVVMASGLCGALMYAWSDTFWFSAVEAEVYAFSSFCTALVFWLILKWDNRADQPGSDRYLVLIAYVIGISIAVHLLNLLTIPALGLVIYFRKSQKSSLKGVFLTLLASFAVVVAILYGLVPGFIYIAGLFELFCVNTLGFSFNIGVVIYAVILVGCLVWAVYSLYQQKSVWQIRVSVILSVILSGMPFIGSSWIIGLLLIGALVYYVGVRRKLSIRLLTLSVLSILVIFVGYSSYALLLIRSSANPPMNQNAPDNVFSLAGYLNREQYGETPLLFGPSFASVPEGVVNVNDGTIDYRTDDGKREWAKAVKTSPDEPDRYIHLDPKPKYRMTPNMVFPRMYSSQPGHPEAYLNWIGETMNDLPKVDVSAYFTPDGKPYMVYGQPYTEKVPRPSFAQNLRYFFTYQLNHMYWRYFMWNFAGRQNDLQGNGEDSRGNWITGINFIDSARLGDQSLLPDELGKDNKGHNVFYMLPLLMGLIGIGAQMARGLRGAQQFWVVFFLFFMTGIAIVLYLNQPPNQPRERDYAFAGSFYAYAIWVGMGVYGLWLALRAAFARKSREKATMGTAVAAAAVALFVPLQVVSQTWDDHDRAGRYTTRDFGMNYLASVDENGIIFTNGDNDTFPLWYAQEVEGYRTDVRVVNLAYLSTDWYANQMRVPSYNAPDIPMTACPEDYAYDRLQVNYISPDSAVTMPVNVFASLKDIYTNPAATGSKNIRSMRYPLMYIPVNVDDAVKAGVIEPDEAPLADDYITVDLSGERSVTLSNLLSLDMIANGAQNGWARPTYFAMTVPDEYYLNLSPYLRNTGLAYQVSPIRNDEAEKYDLPAATDKMYRTVMNEFRWGGLDTAEPGSLYLDETVRRMVTTHRSAILDLATTLYNEGLDYSNAAEEYPDNASAMTGKARERFQMALDVLNLIQEKLPAKSSPYAIQVGQRIGNLYVALGDVLNDAAATEKGREIIHDEILRFGQYIPYIQSLIERRNRQLINAGVYQKASVLDLNLTSTERYAPTYVYQLIYDYNDAGGDLDQLSRELDAAGINLDVLEKMLAV